MTSFSGSVAYLEYVSGIAKGDVAEGELFNGAFGLGEMDEARQNYTAQLIVETVGSDGSVGLSVAASNKFAGEGETGKDVKLVAADGTVSYKTAAEMNAKVVAAAGSKAYYFTDTFQMETVPADKIPSIKPVMRRIALTAEPRRIAVKYDQITAYQA